MTTASLSKAQNIVSTAPTLAYTVAIPEPNSHLFAVTLHITRWTEAVLNLKMAVWTPGSYLVREYARLVQDFRAYDGDDNKTLPARKISKNHWQIQTENSKSITVTYKVYANDLTVRTNHIDGTHAYFNGAALFYFLPGWEKQSVTVTIIPPYPDWKISTALEPVSGETNKFIAPDFDTLVDCPVEIGIHDVYEFEALGKPHKLVIWGQGNANPTQIIADTQKIIAVEADLYEGLPYDRYLFLLHLSNGGYGGLEHKNSCTLNYIRFGLRDKDKYNRFMQLLAHEFFHLWNIKRIRPQALETFDYERENYTSSLWFAEGTTSYYDMVIPLRAGIYGAKNFLEILGKEITRYMMTPGRKVQPLGESSFDAWIKLYRRDNNSDNNQISYYLKGELVSLLLDLKIRTLSQNARSLDDVMKLMWRKFGKDEIGYSDGELISTIESVAGMDLSQFYTHYIDGLEELPFNEYLQPFGLEVRRVIEGEGIPYLGGRIQSENGREIIKFVEMGSPLQRAGIDPEDELLAIDGFKVTGEGINDRLKDYRPGDMIQITVFHQDQLRTLAVQLEKPQPIRYEVVRIDNPTESQQQNFSRWVKQA
ncbi:MAG: hypothetical protein N5P05_002908 [Chroococcopsis gigantea SAG 12.99]|jgi:predicted metalloprotease with PDZ domain|nr:M61 family metallopeptidase [Chlorogloea purpurea SAG 13.99]MDV3001302.1 hypothetical protein [Chroococcopsis gigantea SAG 12.99]